MKTPLLICAVYSGFLLRAAADRIDLKMEDFHSYSPDIISQMAEKGLTEQDLWSNQEFSSRDWVLHHKPVSEFDRGVQGGFWRDMHQNPTIAKTGLKLDWSHVGEIGVALESETKSNNVITLAFRSDPADKKGRGYYTFEIPLDFTGKKDFRFKLDAAGTINRPGGWADITGIYVFAKANGHRPNPYAAVRLISISTQPGNPGTPAKPKPELYQPILADRPTPNLNHSWPEHQAKEPVVTPQHFITYQHHGRNERDLFAYYPRYNPGYVSFSPSGRPYVAAGDLVQWLGDDGKWLTKSLEPALMGWAKSKGYSGVTHNWGSYGCEPTVRFDRLGNAYILIQAEPLDAEGKRGDWHHRTALLLFSPDNFQTITVHELPRRIASFEKIDGNNPAALDRPPVIMLSDYSYFPDADPGLYFVQPKLEGGALKIPSPVQVAPVAIGCNYHSGDGNIVLSSPDKIFVIWGWVAEKNQAISKLSLAALKKKFPEAPDAGKLWTVENLQATDLAKTLPPIPDANAPERNMKFSWLYHHPFHSRFIPADNKNGVPTFISTFDCNTGEKLNTTYVGSAGQALDGHNWGAISFTPDGFIEAIVNGHHNPPLITRSLKPYSADAFEPARFLQPEQCEEHCSYGSLNCDTKGNLFSFHRSTTGTCNNRLVMFRKKPGQPWEPAKTIAAPSKLLYYAWSHKVAINPKNNDLFLCYQGNPSQSFWTPDYYETMLFTYPEMESTLTARNKDPERMKLRPIRFWESWEDGDIVNPRSGEPVVLVSKDAGETWQLAATGDFR